MLNNKETRLTEVLKALTEEANEWEETNNRFSTTTLSCILWSSTVSFRNGVKHKMKALNECRLKASIYRSRLFFCNPEYIKRPSDRQTAAFSLRNPLFLSLSFWGGGFTGVWWLEFAFQFEAEECENLDVTRAVFIQRNRVRPAVI